MATRRTKTRVMWGVGAAFGACVLAALCVLVFMLVSRTVTKEYATRLQLSLNAAVLTEGIHVKADDTYHALDAESYRTLGFYLAQNPVMALWGGNGNEEDRVELKIGDDTLTVTPVGSQGDRAIVRFTTQGKSFRVQIRHHSLIKGIQGSTDERHYEPAEP